MLEVKYFYETSNQDFKDYNKLWNDNKERFIHFIHGLTYKQQLDNIFNNLNDNKDILAIRFPIIKNLNRNKLYNELLLENKVKYNNKFWKPKEIWIYSPFKN